MFDRWKGRLDAERYKSDYLNGLTQLPHVGLRESQRNFRSRSISKKYLRDTTGIQLDLETLETMKSLMKDKKDTNQPGDPAVDCEIALLQKKLALIGDEKNIAIAKHTDKAKSSSARYHDGWGSKSSLLKSSQDSLFMVGDYDDLNDTKGANGKEADHET